MNVPGFLRLTTLGDVLGGIFREGASGVLELTELHGPRAGSVHRVHLVSGLVVHVEASFPGTRLGDVLLQRGLLDPARLRRCAAQLSLSAGVRFGDLLLQCRALSEFALSEGLRLQREERLERLFELSDARLAFHVARMRPGRDALTPPAFLHGRRRYRDLWKERAARRDSVRPVQGDGAHRAPSHDVHGAQGDGARRNSGHGVHGGQGDGAHRAPSHDVHGGQGDGAHRNSGHGVHGAQAHRDAAHAAMRRDPVRARALSTLGLDAAADSTSVKRAFRELARALHPDRHPSATLAERAELMRRFAEITAAYHALVA